jgi:hypothetical protein
MHTKAILMALLCGAGTLVAGELAKDGGFEKDVVGMAGPGSESWGRFASSDPMGLLIVEDPVRRSNQALRIEARDEAGAHQGIFQALPVQDGKTYLVRLRVLEDENAKLGEGTQALLSVEWKNDAGEEVGREDGHPWTGLSEKKWETVEFETVAPSGATKAHFVILQRNPENATGSPGGAFLVDDFSVSEK